MGWGLGPVSAEGWLVTLGFTLLALSTSKRTVAPKWVRYPILGGFLLLLLLKGAAPGGAPLAPTSTRPPRGRAKAATQPPGLVPDGTSKFANMTGAVVLCNPSRAVPEKKG